MGNERRTTIYFGRPNSNNPDHIANLLIKFFNGEYVRGVMIYKKISIMKEPYYLLKYPSYTNAQGSTVPFFRLSQERERKIMALFAKANKNGDFVETYPLSFEDNKIFSKVLA